MHRVPFYTYLGGHPNSCGILRIANNTQVKASDKFEIHDVKLNQFYGFANSSSIPIRNIKCNGEVKPEREIWKDDKGTLWISGLSPSSAQTIRLLSSNPTRNIRANQCGFISLRLGNPQPTAIIIDNQAFSISGGSSGGGIVCRRGKLYVSYPPQPAISGVSVSQWRNQNQINFQVYTSVASIGGATTTWSEPPSSPPPAPAPLPSVEEPPSSPPVPPAPPPPLTCPEGTTGTPPNCVTPPPPLPPPPPPPPPQPPTCPEGYTGTPPNCKPPKPTPVSGKMCRYKGTLVVIGLPPNLELVAYASEFSSYYNRYTTSDSGGWAQFDNFDFSAEYEGDLANVGIAYKKDNGDWESIEDYPDSNFSRNSNFIYIPAIAPCKN